MRTSKKRNELNDDELERMHEKRDRIIETERVAKMSDEDRYWHNLLIQREEEFKQSVCNYWEEDLYEKKYAKSNNNFELTDLYDDYFGEDNY